MPPSLVHCRISVDGDVDRTAPRAMAVGLLDPYPVGPLARRGGLVEEGELGVERVTGRVQGARPNLPLQASEVPAQVVAPRLAEPEREIRRTGGEGDGRLVGCVQLEQQPLLLARRDRAPRHPAVAALRDAVLGGEDVERPGVDDAAAVDAKLPVPAHEAAAVRSVGAGPGDAKPGRVADLRIRPESRQLAASIEQRDGLDGRGAVHDPGDRRRAFGLVHPSHGHSVGRHLQVHARARGAVAVPGHQSVVDPSTGQLAAVHGPETAEDGHLRRRRPGEARAAGVVVTRADDADAYPGAEELVQAPLEDAVVGADLEHRLQLRILRLEVRAPAADVRHHDHLAAGLGHVLAHPRLQVAGVHALGRAGVGGHLVAGKLPVTAAVDGPFVVEEQHVAIAPGAGRPRPLPAEEGDEPARIVVFPCRQANLLQVGVGEDEVVALVGGEVDCRAVAGVGEVLVRCADADGGGRLRLRIPPADDPVRAIADHDGIGDGEDSGVVLERESPHAGAVEHHPVDPGGAAGLPAQVHDDRGIGVQGESRRIDRCRVAEPVVGAHLDAERLAGLDDGRRHRGEGLRRTAPDAEVGRRAVDALVLAGAERVHEHREVAGGLREGLHLEPARAAGPIPEDDGDGIAGIERPGGQPDDGDGVERALVATGIEGGLEPGALARAGHGGEVVAGRVVELRGPEIRLAAGADLQPAADVHGVGADREGERPGGEAAHHHVVRRREARRPPGRDGRPIVVSFGDLAHAVTLLRFVSVGAAPRPSGTVP